MARSFEPRHSRDVILLLRRQSRAASSSGCASALSLRAPTRRRRSSRTYFPRDKRLLWVVSSTDQRNTYLRPRTWSDGDVSSGWIYGSAERGALEALEEG